MATITTPSSAPDAQSSGASGTAAPARSRRLRIFRFRHGDAAPHWLGVDVPITRVRMTILDALMYVRAQVDPSLNVRHSCFHASCGTCGMRVNGKDVLGCVTRLDDLPAGEVKVEPLRNQPLVSDLVVDLESLYEVLEEVGRPLIRRSELVPGARPAQGIAAPGRFEDCIECGICLSACPVEATDAAYLGPAVLSSCWRTVDEPRDGDPELARRFADGEHGAWRCHEAFECTEACPSGVGPAEAIMHLRRDLVRRRIVGVFSRGRGGVP
jgi:succinate dehydrogenase / fumarate reductase iron-sulfur subunit